MEVNFLTCANFRTKKFTFKFNAIMLREQNLGEINL